MTDVRVSKGSPPGERMEGRPADAPKPSACRSLFGPLDHQQLAREWQKQSRQLEAASRRRWNFDFRRGQPLEGRFEWQALGPAALPDFYSRPPRLGREANGARPAPRGLRCASAPAPPAAAAEEKEKQEEEQDAAAAARKSEAAGAALAQSGGPRKRPAADESSPQNKRAASATEEVSKEPLSSSSAEQTPKKSSPQRLQT